MKKLGLLFIVLNVAFFAVNAQVSNAGFEEWDSASVVNGVKIYNPVNWFSRNAEMVGIGKTSPVSRSTDAHSGMYAVKITAKLDDNDKSAGALYSGNKAPIGDPTKSAYEEKFKLNGRIKSYSAWYKYSPADPMDSFIVMMTFYLKGKPYGSAYYTGGATNVYQQFVWTLAYPDNIEPADSAKFIILSSSVPGNAGSELIIDDIAVQYKTPTGIDEVEKASWSLFPNPAKDKITLFGIPPKVRALILTNSVGAIVKESAIVENKMDVSELVAGFYFITILDEDGNRSTVKFLKQ